MNVYVWTYECVWIDLETSTISYEIGGIVEENGALDVL